MAIIRHRSRGHRAHRRQIRHRRALRRADELLRQCEAGDRLPFVTASSDLGPFWFQWWTKPTRAPEPHSRISRAPVGLRRGA
jgi:hypothetical protein